MTPLVLVLVLAMILVFLWPMRSRVKSLQFWKFVAEFFPPADSDDKQPKP